MKIHLCHLLSGCLCVCMEVIKLLKWTSTPEEKIVPGFEKLNKRTQWLAFNITYRESHDFISDNKHNLLWVYRQSKRSRVLLLFLWPVSSGQGLCVFPLIIMLEFPIGVLWRHRVMSSQYGFVLGVCVCLCIDVFILTQRLSLSQACGIFKEHLSTLKVYRNILHLCRLYRHCFWLAYMYTNMIFAQLILIKLLLGCLHDMGKSHQLFWLFLL